MSGSSTGAAAAAAAALLADLSTPPPPTAAPAPALGRIPRACKATPAAAHTPSKSQAATSKAKQARTAGGSAAKASDEPPAAAAAAGAAAPAASASPCCSHTHGEHGHQDASEEEEECSAGDTHHCGVCEGRGILLLCDGPCGRGFHASCMPECPDEAGSSSWYCKECRDKEHECFICHQTGVDDKEVFLCSAAKCGKFYHPHCVSSHPLRGKRVDDGLGFLCPRHRCASCRDSITARTKHLMCLRCTNSYHTLRCMPQIGVYKFLSGEYMLCNTDAETLNATTDRSDEDTVPAEELGLPERPLQPVPTFNPFALPVPAGARAEAAAASSSAAAAASPASAVAASPPPPPPPPPPVSQFFPSVQWTPPTRIQDFKMTGGLIEEGRAFVPKVPPYFKRVAANYYGEFVSKPTFRGEVEVCSCAEQKDKCEDNCFLRAVYTECSRKCPNGEECRNQRISRREYAKTQTESRGWGLIAKEDLAEGALVIEYCGEMITDDECTRRLNATVDTNKHDFYFFKLNKELVIDAGPIGNNARFLNHSCAPNCKTELWQIGAQQRVGIFTTQKVEKGTELTYDYNFEGFWQPGAALKCACGAPNCAGTLGGKKKSKEELAAEEKKQHPKGGSKAAAKAAASAAAKKGLATKRRRLEQEAAAAKAAAGASAASAAAPKRRAPPTNRQQLPQPVDERKSGDSGSGTDTDSDVMEVEVDGPQVARDSELGLGLLDEQEPTTDFEPELPEAIPEPGDGMEDTMEERKEGMHA